GSGSARNTLRRQSRREPAATARVKRNQSRSVDWASRESGNQAESESEIGPALIASHGILERVHVPDEGVGALHRRGAFSRVPHAVAIAFVQEALEQLGPVVIPPEEPETSHQLQPL